MVLFLFSVVVFALLLLLLLFFFIAYTLDTVFTTISQQLYALFLWKSQTGIPKIRLLEISSHLTKLRPNHQINMLVWKAWQDRKNWVMRREGGKEGKRKTKHQCCSLSVYIIYFEDSVWRKKSAWSTKTLGQSMFSKIQLGMHA